MEIYISKSIKAMSRSFWTFSFCHFILFLLFVLQQFLISSCHFLFLFIENVNLLLPAHTHFQSLRVLAYFLLSFVGERNQIEERNKESGFCVWKLLATSLTSKKTLLSFSRVKFSWRKKIALAWKKEKLLWLLHLFVSLFWVTINGNRDYPTFSWNAERMNEMKEESLLDLWIRSIPNDVVCISATCWMISAVFLQDDDVPEDSKTLPQEKEKEKTSYTN